RPGPRPLRPLLQHGGPLPRPHARLAGGPVTADWRDPRRLPFAVVFVMVLLAGMAAYNVAATRHQRDNTLLVNVASRQQWRVELYQSEVLLRLEGLPSDPGAVGRRLRSSADALLEGGTVMAVQGNDQFVRISPHLGWKARRKLERQRDLIGDLTASGDRMLASSAGTGAAAHPAEVQQLRVLVAQLSSVSKDAVGEMTKNAQQSLSDLARLEILLGLLGGMAALVMGFQLRRGAQQRIHARFRSLVHNSSDLITVTDVDGVVRYQSPSIRRLL